MPIRPYPVGRCITYRLNENLHTSYCSAMAGVCLFIEKRINASTNVLKNFTVFGELRLI